MSNVMLVIPGRAKHEPGIHRAARMLGEMDSGFARALAPRNDDDDAES